QQKNKNTLFLFFWIKMRTNFTDEQLMEFLVKSFTLQRYDDLEIGFTDLYGDEKLSESFGTNDATDFYVLTLLKKKKENGKYFSRAIGGGLWREFGGAKEVYDREGSQIGIKKRFRLDEDNHVWTMKEYSLTESKRNDLKRTSEFTAHDELVMCRIRRKANYLVSSSSQCQGTVKSFAQENQDLGLIPSDDIKESQLPAAIEEECSVSVVHSVSNSQM
ncbi:hypothetical protein AABB24_002898, partial [Solanum stoloniferum]